MPVISASYFVKKYHHPNLCHDIGLHAMMRFHKKHKKSSLSQTNPGIKTDRADREASDFVVQTFARIYSLIAVRLVGPVVVNSCFDLKSAWPTKPVYIMTCLSCFSQAS